MLLSVNLFDTFGYSACVVLPPTFVQNQSWNNVSVTSYTNTLPKRWPDKAIGSPHLANEIRQWIRCAELTQQNIEQRVNNAEAVPGAIDIKYTSFLEFMCIHSIRPASRSRADSVCAM